MKPGLVKAIYRRTIGRAARAGLVGRLRDRERQEDERFTRAEVDELLEQTWIAYDQLAPHVPHEPKIGNRMNMLWSGLPTRRSRFSTTARPSIGAAEDDQLHGA
jgi:hypothetical protein